MLIRGSRWQQEKRDGDGGGGGGEPVAAAVVGEAAAVVPLVAGALVSDDVTLTEGSSAIGTYFCLEVIIDRAGSLTRAPFGQIIIFDIQV